jgi:toxin ParE1/3/4
MVEVIWTQPALTDLNNIIEYVSKDSKYYASKLTKAIFELTGKLALYPTIGKPVSELKPSAYKEILFKKYRIIYRIELNNVYIISVHHSSRLLSSNTTFKDMTK